LPGSGEDRPGDAGLGLESRPREPLRTARSGAPYLVPACAALVAAIALGLGWKRVAACGASEWTGPETQIREALSRQDRAHLADVYGFKAGGTVELYPLRFREPAIAVEGRRAVVAAVVDAEGRVAWRDQAARLHYIGREKFGMHPCTAAAWCGEGDQLERLRGVLLALFRRHDAALARDPGALAPLVSGAYEDRGERRDGVLARLAREWPSAGKPRVQAWQVRVEREGAEVGEDLEVEGPGGRVEPVRRLYRLALEDGRWVFVGGL
jgi:hypothetical protein